MHQKLVTIFNEVRKIEPGDERETYLDKACGGDDALRSRIARMLADADVADAFFDEHSPTLRPDDGSSTPLRIPVAGSEKAGDRIDRYKLLQPLGEGGFGTVWMAEQTEPVARRVALKIIKLGMDTREVIARFDVEKRALEMMDHPGVATVLDAGATSSGRPYFVMELVRGLPITQFCDERKLDATERLRLFTEVCSAVNHAHQKGIIHRDLKPSNILVALHGDKAMPKVIDFGIAKATQGKLTDQSLFTRFEQFIGTPAYMSPEQAGGSGIDIDTRSDIYSLGVLLYELLTGKQPFDSKSLFSAGFDEMRRIIREEEPPKPSTRLSTLVGDARAAVAKAHRSDLGKLGRFVRGDLDWIVMKALDKDRTRRYETADAFARDIGRFLASEPVDAAAPSAVYRFRKFARRNHRLMAGLAALAAILVAATAVSLWQAARAREAERISDLARSKAEAVLQETNETLVAELRAIGRLSLLDGVAATAVSYFDGLPGPLKTGRTERLRASALENLAAVLVDRNRITEAAGKLEEAIAIRTAQPAAAGDGRRALAEARRALAEVLKARGDHEDAARALGEAADGLRGGAPLADLATADLQTLAAVHQAQCALYAHRGFNRPEEEEAAFARFVEAIRHLVARGDFDTSGELLAAETVLERGDIATEAGDHETAARRYTEAAALFTELLAKRPEDTRIRKSLAVAHDRRGDAASKADRHEDALKAYRLYADTMKALTEHDPSNLDWQRELSVALNECGDAQLELGNPVAARGNFAEALALRRSLATVDPDHADAQYELVSCLLRLGEIAFGPKGGKETRDLPAAIDSYTEAREIAANAKDEPAADTRWVEREIDALQHLAIVYVARRMPGDFALAVGLAEKAEGVAKAWEADPAAGPLDPKFSSAALHKLAEQLRAAASKLGDSPATPSP